MNNSTVADQLTNSLSQTLYKNAFANHPNVVAYNLDTGFVESGQIDPSMTLAYVGVKPSEDPSKPGYTLKIEFSPEEAQKHRIEKIYVVKGSGVPNTFVQQHKVRLIDMKDRLIHLLSVSSPPQQQQNSLFGGSSAFTNQNMFGVQQTQPMQQMQLPPTPAAGQFGASTGQTPQVGFSMGQSAIFGPTTTNAFGSSSSTPPQTGSSGLFGTAPMSLPQANTGIFGAANLGPPMIQMQTPTQNMSLFGAPNNGMMSNQNPMQMMNNPNPLNGGGIMPQQQQMQTTRMYNYDVIDADPNVEKAKQDSIINAGEEILLNSWRKKKDVPLTEEQIKNNIKAILKASTLPDKSGKINTNDGKAELSLVTEVVLGLKSLPTRRDGPRGLDFALSKDNIGEKKTIGVMYKFGTSKNALSGLYDKSKGVNGLDKLVKSFLSLFINKFQDADGNVSEETLRSIIGNQLPQNYGVYNQTQTANGHPFNQTAGSIFGVSSQPPLPIVNLNQGNFNVLSNPAVSLTHPSVTQTAHVKKHINSYFDELKEFDEFEIFLNNLDAVIVSIKDGDTVDAGVMIPLKMLDNCHRVTGGGREKTARVCSIKGNGENQDDLLTLLNVRFQNVDAAEFHIKTQGHPIMTTKEGWFAKLLIDRLAERLRLDDAELKVDLHGNGMYKRYQGSFKINNVDVGEALSKMTFEGRPVALWGYSGANKSGFTDQFTKYNFKELTENQQEVALMNQAVDQAFPSFLMYFGDYKKNVSRPAGSSSGLQSGGLNLFGNQPSALGSLTSGMSNLSLGQNQPAPPTPSSGGLFNNQPNMFQNQAPLNSAPPMFQNQAPLNSAPSLFQNQAPSMFQNQAPPMFQNQAPLNSAPPMFQNQAPLNSAPPMFQNQAAPNMFSQQGQLNLPFGQAPKFDMLNLNQAPLQQVPLQQSNVQNQPTLNVIKDNRNYGLGNGGDSDSDNDVDEDEDEVVDKSKYDVDDEESEDEVIGSDIDSDNEGV